MFNKKIFISFIALANLSCSDTAPSPSMSWPEPGILQDQIGLSKRTISVGDGNISGGIVTIQVGAFGPTGQRRVAVVGQTGVTFLDPRTLEIKRQIEYKKRSGERIWFGLSPRLIEKTDGDFKIAQLGGGYGEIGLLDSDGNREWLFRPNERLPPNHMEFADVGRNGELQFYVADATGLYRLNESGKVEWKQEGVINDVTIIDDERGRPEFIVTLGERTGDWDQLWEKEGQVRFWTPKGRMVKEIRQKQRHSAIAGIDHDEDLKFAIRTGNRIDFFDRNGSKELTYRFDNLPVVHGPYIKMVKFVSNEAPYIAVLMRSHSAIRKSALSILSPTGTLVFQEVLGIGSGLETSANDDGTERLLVANGKDSLNEYSLSSK